MAALLDQLQPGTKVDTWMIHEMLGKGGYGAVYRCSDDVGEYAMKVESVQHPYKVLNVEVSVLEELRGPHVCALKGYGRTPLYNYMVMTLTGKSLEEVGKDLPRQRFSLACALSCGIETLDAIKDLHSIGYVHRDIKPANFSIGKSEQKRKIFLLDFGMCRKFTTEEGTIRKPRQRAEFRGTVRYAPISCHANKEFTRGDDLESWLYMMAEMITGSLPWKDVQNIEEVGTASEK